jgi:hypothetical protein
LAFTSSFFLFSQPLVTSLLWVVRQLSALKHSGTHFAAITAAAVEEGTAFSGIIMVYHFVWAGASL